MHTRGPVRRAILFTILLASCGSCKKPTPDVAKPTQLVLGLTKEPGTIDPAFARGAPAAELSRLSFLELTELDDRLGHPPDRPGTGSNDSEVAQSRP